MSVSDLVITKPGGLTTTESLASGLPIIVINPIPGQETENAEFLESHNVGFWIKKNDNIEEKLYSIFNNQETLQKMKINARLLAKKNSTSDICKILLGK
jgi:processive 1,2-diacylglycerol beta-glucosyltransferase